MDTDELVELAESRLTRGFTDDECTDYFGSADCPSAYPPGECGCR